MSTSKTQSGFSLVEMLVAITILLIVVAMIFAFFVQFSQNYETENSKVESQQAARFAVDEISRRVQMAGYGIARTDPYNTATWQKAIVHAGPHALAFNADLDPNRGVIPTGTTITFPDGSTYSGSGAATVGGAETYVYTIDANGDNAITLADRNAGPAAETPNPLDFGVSRKVYGWDGTTAGGTAQPLAGYLFTNATAAVVYPNGAVPDPLFEYWLTEDLDANGLLSNSECVVPPCPPGATRPPKLYLWGDTNFDGVLSITEKNALITLPVGSPAWAGNPLAVSGAYRSTTLSVAVDPASSSSYVLSVASAAGFGPGDIISIDTGANAEKFVIDTVTTTVTPNQIGLTTNPVSAHAVNAAITILPDTFLRAIRTVEINYNAISPQPVSVNQAAAPAGLSGRAGTNGLDYAVRKYTRRVDLVNMRTSALVRGAGAAAMPTCPLTIAAVCSGSANSTIDVFLPASGTLPVSFLVTDGTGAPASGATVILSNNTSLGTLTATTLTTTSAGLATTAYTPGSTVGDDVITASASCLNAGGNLQTQTATYTVKMSQIQLVVAPNCLSTVSSRTPTPTSTFTLSVIGSSGARNNFNIDLSVGFNAGYVPAGVNYTQLGADLIIGGSTVASTDTSTGMLTYSTNTGSTGVLTGSLVLSRDLYGNGTQIGFKAAKSSGGSCTATAGSNTINVTYYKVNITTVPAGCTELTPCLMPADSSPPQVKATVSVNGLPIANEPMSFVKQDVSGSGASSVFLNPASGWTTDATGVATVNLVTDPGSIVSLAQPLNTFVDVTTTGAPSQCSNANIVPVDPRAEFVFEGQVGGCDITLVPASIFWGANQKTIKLAIQNINLATECPIAVQGIGVGVFNAAGTALEISTGPTGVTITQLNGGAVNTNTTVTTTGSVLLFKKANGAPGPPIVPACNANANLNNGAFWTFQACGTGPGFPTATPPSTVPGQSFLDIDNVLFQNNVPLSRRVDITVSWACAGSCAGGTTQTRTFTVNVPATFTANAHW